MMRQNTCGGAGALEMHLHRAFASGETITLVATTCPQCHSPHAWRWGERSRGAAGVERPTAGLRCPRSQLHRSVNACQTGPAHPHELLGGPFGIGTNNPEHELTHAGIVGFEGQYVRGAGQTDCSPTWSVVDPVVIEDVTAVDSQSSGDAIEVVVI